MKKIIELKNHPHCKYAGLRYHKSDKYFYVWYQAGPFTLHCEKAKTIEEAEKKLNNWLTTTPNEYGYLDL